MQKFTRILPLSIVLVAATSNVAESATLALTDEIVVAGDGTVVPFGDPLSGNSAGPANAAAFRYTARERQNTGQLNRRVASFLEFDTSALTAADVNAVGFAATMTIEHVGHLNNLNTGSDLSVGRNVSGAWDSAGSDPQFAWAASAADQAVILARLDLNPNSVNLSFDVTPIVQGWVNSGTNDGLILFSTSAPANGGNNVSSQASYLVDPSITTIPEPSALGLLGLGLVGLIARRRR